MKPDARVWRGAVAGAAVILIAAAAASAGTTGVVAQDDGVDLYLPLTLSMAQRGDLASPMAPEPAPTGGATQTPATQPATETSEPTISTTPSATGTVYVPPSITPLASNTPTPTTVAVPSSIKGKITADGEPLPAGYGLPFYPQIELRHCDGFADHECVGDEWLVVDRTVSLAGGLFAFENPNPLGEGDAYQVWWRNDLDGEFQGTDLFLHRWWSRPVLELGPGDVVDLGVFEVGDLKLREICHDCGQSLPILFKWDARPNASEVYYWSLFRGCGEVSNRYTAFRTRSLGHESEYELGRPPPGFRLNEKYCWYLFIEDGDNGTGWPFHDWRVTFLPTPGDDIGVGPRRD